MVGEREEERDRETRTSVGERRIRSNAMETHDGALLITFTTHLPSKMNKNCLFLKWNLRW